MINALVVPAKGSLEQIFDLRPWARVIRPEHGLVPPLFRAFASFVFCCHVVMVAFLSFFIFIICRCKYFSAWLVRIVSGNYKIFVRVFGSTPGDGAVPVFCVMRFLLLFSRAGVKMIAAMIVTNCLVWW